MTYFTVSPLMNQKMIGCRVIINPTEMVKKIALNKLNPNRYYLSEEAKKRLTWIGILYFECSGNVTVASRKIGLTREWLSKLKNKFENHKKDPRSLEPESRAPNDTSQSKKIHDKEKKIILRIRETYGWGQAPIKRILERDHGIIVGESTVYRVLKKENQITPKLTVKNEKAWEQRRLNQLNFKENKLVQIKYRPPSAIKDLAPGVLIEKDMKMVPTKNKKISFSDRKYHRKAHFNYQQTFLDSFTRMRSLSISAEPDSAATNEAYQSTKKKFPFPLATFMSDNGGENMGIMNNVFQKDRIIHFFSRSSSPTDNPRVERSHLTDEVEFYSRGNAGLELPEQQRRIKEWEWTYNFYRPHMALSHLTPMEFYELWKTDPEKAYAIKEKYQKYLIKQRRRQANSRKIKNKNQIELLMTFIDQKLNGKNVEKTLDFFSNFKSDFIFNKCEVC